MIERKSHGSGAFSPEQFSSIGAGTILEPGVLVFHPENIQLGSRVYIGHNTILKGYFRNIMRIGEGTVVGPQCFFHSAGGLTIGCHVTIAPGVYIITSHHGDDGIDIPILHSRIEFAPVVIEDDAMLEAGSIILPGVRIGKGARVRAGSVASRNVEPYTEVIGVPAKLLPAGEAGP